MKDLRPGVRIITLDDLRVDSSRKAMGRCWGSFKEDLSKREECWLCIYLKCNTRNVTVGMGQSFVAYGFVLETTKEFPIIAVF